MEHRWNPRQPLVTDVVVECASVGRLHARMHDVSLGGMRIETSSSALSCNTPVMVSFRLPSRARDGGYHLHAIVVRRTGGNAGLMFLDLGSGTADALREELRSLSHQALPREFVAASYGEARTP